MSELEAEVDAFAESGEQTLTISGGEPTVMRARLIELTKRARRGGVRFVELQTNAILIDDGYAAALAEAGVTSAFVSLLSDDAALHDELTAIDGSFARCLTGIDALDAHGIRVTLNPVVAHATQHRLAGYIDFVAARLPFVKSISLSAVQPHGRAHSNAELMPDYAVLRALVPRARERAKAHGIELLNPYCGLPLCIGWDDDLENCVEAIEARLNLRVGRGLENTGDKSHGAPCVRCALRTMCGGAWHEYWQVRGGSGISAPIAIREPWLEDARDARGQQIVDAIGGISEATWSALHAATEPTVWLYTDSLCIDDVARLLESRCSDLALIVDGASVSREAKRALDAIERANADRPQHRQLRVHLAPSSRTRSLVDIGGAVRYRGRLDDVDDTPPRAIDDIVNDVHASTIVLAGGEPTLRADLPQLIAAVRQKARVGIRTDGLALTTESVVQSLIDAGLSFVIIAMPSARADAHDWLAMRKGVSRRVRKAISVCASAGLRVEVEITLTRPTLAHAAETVEAAARLGATAVRLRRLTARGSAANDYVALAPRLLQMLPAEEAIVRALELHLDVSIEGVPRCFLNTTRDYAIQNPKSKIQNACSRCGDERCEGLPDDYFSRFGAGELRATVIDRQESLSSTICVVIDPKESSRSAGLRIARAAQERPKTLRLVDVFAHHDAVELIREALRLDVGVEIAGDVSGLAKIDDRARLHIARVARIDGDGEVPALKGYRNSSTYAVIQSAADVEGWASTSTAFRLSPSGGSLAELAHVAGGKPALLALLPACLHDDVSVEPFSSHDMTWWGATAAERIGAANDRDGRFDPCPERGGCARAARCPGLAQGWDAKGIAPR
jgi:MoaA/NifB/PqqE/SkfB family radical SAM enzyme